MCSFQGLEAGAWQGFSGRKPLHLHRQSSLCVHQGEDQGHLRTAALGQLLPRPSGLQWSRSLAANSSEDKAHPHSSQREEHRHGEEGDSLRQRENWERH